MTADPPHRPDFTTRLTQAIQRYEASWEPADGELYDLCRRRPSHDDFADVYTKVAIIGRVYAAGVARAWRGQGDPETEITRVLIEQADRVQGGLQDLDNRSFDRQAAAEIAGLHGHAARAISHRTNGVFLTSFVSKYLHFHCPAVPIYDSNAQAAIGQYTDRELVNPIRKAMADMPEWARAYRNFVAAFVVLYERAHAQTPFKPDRQGTRPLALAAEMIGEKKPLAHVTGRGRPPARGDADRGLRRAANFAIPPKASRAPTLSGSVVDQS